MARRVNSSPTQLPVESRLASLDGATEWLKSHPLIGEELRGRVALVQFGTFTCIDGIRTLPYVRAWVEKYGPAGLAVVGIQTPEFQFEQDFSNVRRSLQEMRIDYPVAIDNDYAVWRAFDNHDWPASTLPTRRAASATTTSARPTTSRPSSQSSSYSPRPALAISQQRCFRRPGGRRGRGRLGYP